MSNIVLTTECPRKCSYCFAKDNQDSPMEFTMEDFKTAIDWMTQDDSPVTRIGLLGGEPTAHPLFLDFLDYTLSKRFNTLVFTNAMMEDEDQIYSIIDIAIKNKVKHTANLGFCVNVNEEKYRSKKEQHLQTRFLKILGRVSVLSFNIFEESCDFDFLVDLIEQFKMTPAIRFGLAAPLGNRNNFLDPEKYKVIAKKLTDFSQLRKKYGISMGMDCGFPKCMFTEQQIEVIKDAGVDIISYNCGPTLDIYPNLEIASCYPLSKLMRVKMEDYESYARLYAFWEEEINKLKPIYDECYECKYFLNHECSGGCRAHRTNG